MTPNQITEILVGIAQTQAALVDAISETMEKAPVVSEVKQSLRDKLRSIQGGAHQKPVTLQTLPAKVLSLALAPSSPAGRTMTAATLVEVVRLLGKEPL